MHQYPLHRISYCADDKGEKKFFSFIAKEEDAERHTCFVFVSDKLAEEITLTIGQAFDLAYRRFLETSGKDLETQRRCMVLQQKIKRLEHENNVYRQRLQDIAAIKGSVSSTTRREYNAYMSENKSKNGRYVSHTLICNIIFSGHSTLLLFKLRLFTLMKRASRRKRIKYFNAISRRTCRRICRSTTCRIYFTYLVRRQTRHKSTARLPSRC